VAKAIGRDKKGRSLPAKVQPHACLDNSGAVCVSRDFGVWYDKPGIDNSVNWRILQPLFLNVLACEFGCACSLIGFDSRFDRIENCFNSMGHGRK